MPERPLLILPTPEPVDKPKGRGGSSDTTPPDKDKQVARLEKQFASLNEGDITDAPSDIGRVLVMETSDKIDEFKNAVRRIDGLEWLAEMDVDNIELHNLYDKKTGKKIKGGRFYLLLSNEKARNSLRGLWEKYQEDGKLEQNYGKFSEMFKYLITLRYWNVSDRLRDTGVWESWQEEYKMKKGFHSIMSFEIELHYRKDPNKQDEQLQYITKEIKALDGAIGKSICNDDIAFHALKVDLPVQCFDEMMEYQWSTEQPTDNFPAVFQSDAIRYCRPIGQHISLDSGLPEYIDETILLPVDKDRPPMLAMLDGAPILRHRLLDERIVFEDPDEYKESYSSSSEQKHGTAMASLICHGDLSHPQAGHKSLPRKIYVRPVMKPDNLPSGEERIPPEYFQEDIIERAVREMFTRTDSKAKNVCVINFSLGNIDQHYLHEMSPWAKLLDWLSFRYKVLFIVSAGNYTDSIKLTDRPVLITDTVINTNIDENQRNHRLLSPAESMNALTVGALQGDFFGALDDIERGSDPMNNEKLPAPYSRSGPGYSNSIKPEIFTNGGRLLYNQRPNGENILDPVISNEPPGVKTASPDARPEILHNTTFQSGTSHAAAIASHAAGHIIEMLEELRADNNALSSDFNAVLIKTLLVHSASKGENNKAYNHLQKHTPKYLSRFLGYGNIDIERILECTQVRATAIGFGAINNNERHPFQFPLPDLGAQDYLRLTVTLAWLSPINPSHLGWRRAKLFFESNELTGDLPSESNKRQVRKGTVQHEIFDLRKQHLPQNGPLNLFVQCGAGTLDQQIPYGLAVTLEIAPTQGIDLYQKIKQQIATQITVSH